MRKKRKIEYSKENKESYYIVKIRIEDTSAVIKSFLTKQDATEAIDLLESEQEIFYEMGYKHRLECDYTEFTIKKSRRYKESEASSDLKDCMFAEDINEFCERVALAQEISVDQYKEKRERLLGN